MDLLYGDNMKELLFSVTKKDFRIDTFRSGGPGGQHQNKTDSGVRITHLESGAVGESRSERFQPMNKKLAFKRLLESAKWKLWLAKKIQESKYRESVEEKVDRQMREVIVEVCENGEWEYERG